MFAHMTFVSVTLAGCKKGVLIGGRYFSDLYSVRLNIARAGQAKPRYAYNE